MSRFAKTRETLGVSIRSGAGNERLETNSAVLAHARALNSRGLSGKFDTRSFPQRRIGAHRQRLGCRRGRMAAPLERPSVATVSRSHDGQRRHAS